MLEDSRNYLQLNKVSNETINTILAEYEEKVG